MKKKLHKTGTTILLALAPAAALGITTGIVANLVIDTEKEVTADEWFTEYKKASDKFQNTIDSYSKDDVEIIYNDQKTQNTSAYQYYSNGVKWVYIYFKIASRNSGCYLNTDPAETLKTRVTSDTTYKVSRKYLTINIPNSTIENGHEKIVFNREGYIVSYDIVSADWTAKYEVKYLTSPYHVTKHELNYYQIGQYYMSGYALLQENTTYTFTINLDGTNSINSFNIAHYLESAKLFAELSDVKVTGLSSGSWTLSQNKKNVIFTDPQKSGKITIECKISTQSNGWTFFVPQASLNS